MNKVIDALGQNTLMTNDRVGNIISTSTPNGLITPTTFFTYDALNRRVESKINVNGIDLITNYTYDKNSNLLTVNEPEGRVAKYEYDELNRKTKTINNAQGTGINGTGINGDDVAITKYTYDGVGNLIAMTDANDNPPTTYSYDAVNRQHKVTDALGKVVGWALPTASNQDAARI